MKIITSSIRNSFKQIKENKTNFLLVFLLQSIFFIAISILIYKTVIPASERMEEIQSYSAGLQLDDLNVAKTLLSNESLLGQDPELIIRSYNQIKRLFLVSITLFILLFIFMNGSIWYVTNRFLNRKINYLRYLLNFGLLAIINFFLIYLIILPNIIFTEENTKMSDFFIVIIIFLILQYFFYIFVSKIDKNSVNQFKQSFIIGLKKAHWILLSYFINIVLTLSSFLLAFYFAELNIIFGILTTILFIFIFCLKRLVFINVVDNL